MRRDCAHNSVHLEVTRFIGNNAAEAKAEDPLGCLKLIVNSEMAEGG